MENLTICLNAVLPIFLSMAAGYAARCVGIIKADDVPKFNKVIFNVFISCMVFNNVYASDISSVSAGPLIIYALLGVTATFFAAWGVVCLAEKDADKRGVAVQAVFRSNFVIIGLPLALNLAGESARGVIALLLMTVIPLYNILAVIILAIYCGQKPSFLGVIKKILKNPLMIGTVLGVLFVFSGIRLPTALEDTVSDFGSAASPMMIFLLGAFFRFETIGKYIKRISIICLAKLVVLPGIFLTLGAALGFRGAEFAGLLGVFGSATATTTFPMAQQMGGDAEFAGDIVVSTSLLCSFTLFGWSFLFKTLGIF